MKKEKIKIDRLIVKGISHEAILKKHFLQVGFKDIGGNRYRGLMSYIDIITDEDKTNIDVFVRDGRDVVISSFDENYNPLIAAEMKQYINRLRNELIYIFGKGNVIRHYSFRVSKSPKAVLRRLYTNMAITSISVIFALYLLGRCFNTG